MSFFERDRLRYPVVRLVHTSDWHIGRRFHQVDLLDDQSRFFDWLVEFVSSEGIDGVLVAGDIFDRASPAADAVDLVDDVLSRLLSRRVTVVMISGNHDSAERLNFGSRAMDAAGLHIRTERPVLSDVGAPIVIQRGDESLEVLPIPYLEPARIVDLAGAVRRHDTVVEHVVTTHIGTLTDPSRAVAVSHAFVAGGSASDSERQLTVGGAGTVPPSVFDGLGYVALGHLHRPQTCGRETLAYSGSPIPYSFSEQHDKIVKVLDTGTMIVTDAPVGAGRAVCTIEDTLDKVLASSRYSVHEESFVRVRLTDPDPQLGAMDRIRRRFPHCLALEQIALRPQSPFESRGGDGVRKKPEEIVGDYLEETFGDALSVDARSFVMDGLGTAMAGDDR